MKSNYTKFLFMLMLTAIPSGAWAQSYKQLTDLPAIYVETFGRQPITSKEEYIYSKLTCVDGEEVKTYDSTQIRGRGNSSWWNSDKKPYRIKLAKKKRFLGKEFAKAKSWTLLANHGDKTLMRNALTYDLGKFIGLPFCPAAKFVDLYLNGEYQGNYQISDQVQVHSGRVEIDEPDGWFIEVANDNSREDPCFRTSNGILYNIKNPDDENYTDEKRRAIRQWVQQMENAVYSANFDDPAKGYRAYIDETDLINWYVGVEITGNIDALYSIYMYKDKDEEKIHFGPIWDLDLGYDNSSERSMLREMEAFNSPDDRPFKWIIQRMWEDPWFAKSCRDRLKELTDAGLQNYLLQHIDSLRGVLYRSQAENFRIWRIDRPVYSWANQTRHWSYDEYVADLRNFINIHIPYLSAEFEKRYVATGIREVEADALPADNEVYNLRGQKVGDGPLAPGIYVRNGRKFVVK